MLPVSGFAVRLAASTLMRESPKSHNTALPLLSISILSYKSVRQKSVEKKNVNERSTDLRSPCMTFCE
jgi:hypothetical protein